MDMQFILLYSTQFKKEYQAFFFLFNTTNSVPPTTNITDSITSGVSSPVLTLSTPEETALSNIVPKLFKDSTSTDTNPSFTFHFNFFTFSLSQESTTTSLPLYFSDTGS